MISLNNNPIETYWIFLRHIEYLIFLRLLTFLIYIEDLIFLRFLSRESTEILEATELGWSKRGATARHNSHPSPTISNRYGFLNCNLWWVPYGHNMRILQDVRSGMIGFPEMNCNLWWDPCRLQNEHFGGRPQQNDGFPEMKGNLWWDPGLIKMSILHEIRRGSEGGDPKECWCNPKDGRISGERRGVGIYTNKD